MISSFSHEAGRCQPPAIGDAVTAGPPLSSAPVCPCSPDDEHKLRVVAWSRNSREALFGSVCLLSETIFTPDAMWWCQPAVSFPGPRQKCLDVNIGQPAGGARLLLISRGVAFLGLFLPNSTLCFAMPVLHRCANHGSIGTCVVDDRKPGKPCGPVGEKRKEKANGDRQSTRQGSRVEFVSTSLDLNLIPSLRGLEKKRCHALPSSLRSCEPSVWCP